jgi:hypothetical protein
MLLPPVGRPALAGLQRHLERDLGEAVDDLVEARIVLDNIISDRVGVLVGDAPVAAERAALVDPGAAILGAAAAELRGSPDQQAHRIVRGYHQEAHQLLRRLAAAAGAAEPDTLAAELHRVIYGMLVEAMVASPATAAAARRQAEALLLTSVAPQGPSGSS